MKYGIVGNNDGPMYLLEGLSHSHFQPEFVGLQKPVPVNLQKSYQKLLHKIAFFEGFDEKKLIAKLDAFNLDLLINCFCNFRFDKILDQSYPVLNVHLSPLPAYRGRHPVQWALINGEDEFGITIHQMTEKYDAGNIYWQKIVPVNDEMSVHELRTLLMEKLEAGFAQFLDDYENANINPLPNNDKTATYLPQRSCTDSKLTEWHNSQKIYRKVMALRSEDYAAYISIDDLKITCHFAKLAGNLNKNIETACIKNIREHKFQVACEDGKLLWLYAHPQKIRPLKVNQEIC